MKNSYNIERILNSCIYFEEYKTKPIESYINRFNNSLGLDNELLKHLQLQYITDKSYFM